MSNNKKNKLINLDELIGSPQPAVEKKEVSQNNFKKEEPEVKENKEVSNIFSFIRCRLCDFIGVDRSDLAQHNAGV